jgi:hypothetical protein
MRTQYKIQITRNGQPIEFQQLRANDLVTATFVTPKEECRPTAGQRATRGCAGCAVAASHRLRPRPFQVPAAALPPAAAAEPAPKTLPKTASPLPLVGLVGGLLVAMGIADADSSSTACRSASHSERPQPRPPHSLLHSRKRQPWPDERARVGKHALEFIDEDTQLHHERLDLAGASPCSAATHATPDRSSTGAPLWPTRRGRPASRL